MKKRFFFSLPFILLLCSWGFLVHRISPQLAVYQLPRPMQGFFFQHLDELVYQSVRPDTRRDKDPAEAPRHYIDFEIYGDSAAWKMPETWAEASAKYSKDTLLKYGTLPWRVADMQQKLTEAFRNRQKDSILYYAAEVCHYVGDAHVPLHTSLNYDGQLSNQKGLHALWESTLPEMDLAEYQLYQKHKAQYLPDTQHSIWQILRDTHQLTQQVFDEERKASESMARSEKYNTKTGRGGKPYQAYSGVFAKAYSKRLAESVQVQLRKTSMNLANFWATAWIDAGRPNLSNLEELTPQTRQQFKAETKLWKQNELLSQNMLRAKKPTKNED